MIDPLPPLHYPREDEQLFHQQLHQAVQEYLLARGDHHYANRWQWLKCILMLLLAVLCYSVSLMTAQPWIFFLSYFLFITLTMLLNVNVNHDASHNTFSRQMWLNRIIGRVVTLPLGIDPDYWRVRHVVYHHRYANIEHYDLDTEENGFFRQSPFQKWRWYMRYQHRYWPLIAAVSLPWIAWVFDWSDRLNKTPLQKEKLLAGGRGWALFVGSKICHLLLVLIVPLLVCQHYGIPWAVVILAYWLSQMFSSLLVVFLLLGTHWADVEFFQPPADTIMPHGWYHHNFVTACDWVPSPPWLHHVFGGLNYHLTHHLFPNYHHRHYPALAAIIATLSAKHQMGYRCIGYRELLACQRHFLQQLGQSPHKGSR